MDRYKDHPSFGSDGCLKKPIKRIAAIHDISCLGRCALTIISPVLSVIGHQCVPLPTALLSTHTGGFTNMFFSDLTHHMGEIANHWRSIGTDFDAIYSGFLGSADQIAMLTGFIKDFSKKNDGSPAFIAIDPVMGDDGELYSTYNSELMMGMSRLCYGADLITPNLTEACFLTGEKYPFHTLTEDAGKDLAEKLLKRLSEKFGCKKTVVSGIICENESGKSVLTAATDEKKAMPYFHSTALMSRSYPGTGDLFASVLLGKLLLNEDFESSLDYACDFTAYAIAFSEGYSTPIRDGLVIEPCLSKLTLM